VARIPDARAPTPLNKGQWRIKAVGGRGNRCLCRHELITIVMPLSRPGSAKTAASVGLYSVYKKQERSLFTAALEQTSNVLTAIVRLHPTAGLWSLMPSIRSTIASLCRAARLLFDMCAMPRRLRPGRCPPFHAPIPLATSTDYPAVSDGDRGEAVIPRLVVRGPMAVALPRSRSPCTIPLTVLGAPLPAMLMSAGGDGVPSSAGNGGGCGR